MVTGGRTPVLSVARLTELGYAAAIFPTMGFLSAAQALRQAYGELRTAGESSATPMYSFADFSDLIGFPDVWDFERRYAEDI